MLRFLTLMCLPLLMIIAIACGTGSAPDATGGEPSLMIIEPWARASTLDGGNSALYLTVRNEGGDDVLLGAATTVAEAVEIHESSMDENDVMHMSPVSTIAVPSGESVNLEPGGKHVMLIGLKEQLKAGDTIEVTLTFERAGEVVVDAEIRGIGAEPNQ
ncbi:MAG: copper chaperone PCu(A)C [Anaerolineae bacterium]|nr:copper chaperone PCu(A)C [Anaerolineae bacterium]